MQVMVMMGMRYKIRYVMFCLFIYIVIILRMMLKSGQDCKYYLTHPITVFKVKKERKKITKARDKSTSENVKYKRKWVQINRQG